MIELRPFDALGGADHGWLKAKHHFSFARYYDPDRLGHGSLRVWNDDEIAPHTGFPPHPHAEMEIITYVRQGAITHEDSLGHQGRTEAGDVQVMSAGSGIRHAEYNREAGADQDLPDLDRAERGRRRAVLGRQAVPQIGPLGAVGAAGQRLRRRRRGVADQGRGPRARRHAESRRDRQIRAGRRAGTAISFRPKAASRSMACGSARATARLSPTRLC